jgi:hypothetical protein
MNDNNHLFINYLLIFGLFYIYYIAHTDPKVKLKDCFYYLIGLVMLYLFYVRFSIYSDENINENFDIFGADLTEFDSNNKASLDIYYKEKTTGRANKYSKSKSSSTHQYSLFGPNQLKSPDFDKDQNLKLICNSKTKPINLIFNDKSFNFLMHTDNFINFFISKGNIKSKIYDYHFPQKWMINVVDKDNTKCLVNISTFPSKDKTKYYLCIKNDRLSVSHLIGGFINGWYMYQHGDKFLFQSAFNHKYLTVNNVPDINNNMRVYLENENKFLFNDMLWKIVESTN